MSDYMKHMLVNFSSFRMINYFLNLLVETRMSNGRVWPETENCNNGMNT